MMKTARWKVISALALFALLLSGCINIQQEYWLNGDGSAKVSMDVGMSEALLSMGSASGGSAQTNPLDDLKNTFNTTNPHIKNVQVHEYKDNNLQHFAVTFDVNNFEDFLKTQTSSDGAFNITLSHQADGSIVFTQLTDLNTVNQPNDVNPATLGSVFKDMYWMVTVHAPAVISTNGTLVDDGTAAQWKIPMADVFSGKAPGQLVVAYKTAGSGGLAGLIGGGSGGGAWWVWLIAGLVLALLAGGAVVYFLVMRRRPAAAYPGYPPAGGAYPPGPAPQAGYPQPPMPPQNPPSPQEGFPQEGFPQGGAWPPPAGPVQPELPQPPEPPQSPVELQASRTPASPAAYPNYPQYQFPKFPPAPEAGGPNAYTPYPKPQQPLPPPEEPPGQQPQS